MARQHTTKKKVTHYTLMLIFVQQQQAALPTPYGSTNGSSIRPQRDGFSAAKGFFAMEFQ
jgi:hypothetical protein